MMSRLLAALMTGAVFAAPLSAGGAAFEEPRSAERFAPQPSVDRAADRLDWAHWDEALGWMVIPMGPSLRQGAVRVEPMTGSRRIYGHESRLRLEGNRVAFSYLEPAMITALGEYRADLERIGGEIDLAALPRNEQLAFWLNLHNVAVIEALAKAHPLAEPFEHRFGPDAAPLDDAKLVTIGGIELSPREIRETIVYPHWKDPKVIYGFWRGVIGGPSIQRLAFTGDNVDALLALSGEEFVNSLRGVEAWGGKLRVSRIYEEASPFYFADDAALHAHLAKFAGADVAALLRKHDAIAYTPLESDIADLERGETDPNIVPLQVGVCDGACWRGGPGETNPVPLPISINPAVARLMRERETKLERAVKKGIRTGMVIYGNGEYAPDAPVREVE